MDAGLRVIVTPAGAPGVVSAIAASKPPEAVVVTVDVPLLPTVTVTEAGEALSVKAGLVLAGAPSALIRPAPLGLPQLVTRS